jgi:hypothetical protein
VFLQKTHGLAQDPAALVGPTVDIFVSLALAHAGFANGAVRRRAVDDRYAAMDGGYLYSTVFLHSTLNRDCLLT